MSEKVITYEEANKKIIKEGCAKVIIRYESGVADIFDIYKEKYIGTVGSAWAGYIVSVGKLPILQIPVAVRRIKKTPIINIFEAEVR